MLNEIILFRMMGVVSLNYFEVRKLLVEMVRFVVVMMMLLVWVMIGGRNMVLGNWRL